MEGKPKIRSIVFVLVLSFLLFEVVMCLVSDHEFPSIGPLVDKESRKVLSSSDSGLISALDVLDRYKGVYHLQFITMEPGSLFLPVLLHADMVFYVHTGKGTVTWVGDDGTDSLDVKKGDIYKLDQGTVFYVHSHPDATREKLRIHAIFDTQENFVDAYSNLSDLVRGFDDKVLQMGFQVSEEAIQTIKGVEKPPPIVPFKVENESDGLSKNWGERLMKAIIGSQRPLDMIYNKKKKKSRAFNLLTTKHNVENCNGWSVAVTSSDFKALRGCDIGVFMVNLTKGSMMGPHWNPRGTEIAIAIHGQGMVQVVCPSEVAGDEGIRKCQNERFKVKEGDVFIVPRFHPMAQISFNNDSFVFVGFSSNVKKNYPQFLAGKWSVFRTIRKDILAMSFNVGNETVEELWASQNDAVMLECASCAEEAERQMEEEIERKREEKEEAAKKREEEAKRREEEEEEEAKRREEEEEEAKRREEEEEAKRRKEEEEAKRREEEEEAAKRREEEEEEAKRREEEEQEAKRKEEEEEAAAAAKRREQEEQEAKSREEEQEQEAKEETEEEEQESERQRRKEQEQEVKIEEAEDAAKKRREEDREIENKEKGEGKKRALSRKISWV